MNRRPNFFIVGAPKCGTTALSAYLASHPNIYVSSPKEPHHFASDFPSIQGSFRKQERYLELFSDASDDHKAIGEASVWYLYSSDALPAIQRFDPSAKIIIMLRNPTDLVISLHSQQLFSQNEDQVDFQKAWSLQEARSRGDSLPKRLRHSPRVLQYGQIGQLSWQLERAYSIFPKEQVHVILFDDFAASTGSEYRAILSFLGVKDDGKSDFPRINANKESRIPFITRVTRHGPSALKEILNKNKTIRNLKYGVISWIDRWNQVAVTRTPPSPKFRDELSSYYSSDVAKLQAIIGKDLSHWR